MPLQELGPAAGIVDPRAERLVLSGALKEAALVLPGLVGLGITEAHFGWFAHGVCYRHIYEMWDGHDEVGLYSLYRRLEAAGDLAELGPQPAQWLADVWDDDPTGAWAVPAARRVRWLAARRAAVHRAQEIIRDAVSGHMGPDDPRLAMLGVEVLTNSP